MEKQEGISYDFSVIDTESHDDVTSGIDQIQIHERKGVFFGAFILDGKLKLFTRKSDEDLYPTHNYRLQITDSNGYELNEMIEVTS